MTTESSAHPRKEGHIKARPIRASELVPLFQTLTLLFQIFPFLLGSPKQLGTSEKVSYP